MPPELTAASAMSPGDLSGDGNMNRLMIAVLMTAFAIGSALAQDTCESKAVGKDGRPLAGAAKTSFLKKCRAEGCEPKAIGKDGKPLAGAARAAFIKKCEEGA